MKRKNMNRTHLNKRFRKLPSLDVAIMPTSTGKGWKILPLPLSNGPTSYAIVSYDGDIICRHMRSYCAPGDTSGGNVNEYNVAGKAAKILCQIIAGDLTEYKKITRAYYAGWDPTYRYRGWFKKWRGVLGVDFNEKCIRGYMKRKCFPRRYKNTPEEFAELIRKRINRNPAQRGLHQKNGGGTK
jgi:hypothetical protein